MFKFFQKDKPYLAKITRPILKESLIGLILVTIYSLPLYAQANKPKYSLENKIIPDPKLEWSFTSENESTSLKNKIQNLETYNLSQSDSQIDTELQETNRRWGNKGDIEDYSLEVEVYEY